MKTLLVTGGSRGIGAYTALEFAKQGYNVAINYFNSKDKAFDILNKIKEYNVKAMALQADISCMEQVTEMVQQINAELGTIDVLVNNGGIAQQKLFTDITQGDWARMLGVNLTGVFNCTQAVLPQMLSNHSGRIINISSMWGQIGGSCEVHYSAAKAGVIGMTKALAKEVAPSGITVNCICPGVIMTDMMTDFDSDTLKELTEDTPVGRLGTPQDVAGACLFLASKGADFITGQILGVNGGMVI